MDRTYHPITNIEEVAPYFAHSTIFGSLTHKQLEGIVKLLKTVNYDEGEFIYKRGDHASFIYIIKQGEVKMVIDNADVYLELISFKDGDCFGETSVIGIQSHSSSAFVVKPTELIVLEPSNLLNIFDSDKELFGILILNIARETARRLHQANEALVKFMMFKKKG